MRPASRWMLLLLLMALTVSACRPVTRAPDQAAAPELNPAHVSTIKQFLEVWNDTDTAELATLVSPDLIQYNADIPDLTSQAALAAMVVDAHSVVPDLHQTLLDVFGDGEWYVVRSEMGGTWTDPFAYGGMGFIRMADDRIAEVWWVSDEAAVEKIVDYFPNPEGRLLFSWGADSTVAGDPGDPQANKALAEQWWQGDEAVRAGLTSDQFVFHSTQFPDQHSYAERTAAIAELGATFSDLQMSVQEPVVAMGDKVGFRFTATGVNSGSFFGLEPVNEPISWPGVAVYRIADGKIVEEWILWSLANLYYKLGGE